MSELEAFLHGVIRQQEDIAAPNYVSTNWATDRAQKSSDDKRGAGYILGRVNAMTVPIIGFLGPYSSGKTFLINKILGEKRFLSNLEPTTSAIVVIRHMRERPSNWSSRHDVFSLKADSSPRSLRIEDVSDHHFFDDLKELTTYRPDKLGYKQPRCVVCFLNNPVLEKVSLLDCPGAGSLSKENTITKDIKNVVAQTAADKKQRENELISLAARTCDGFVVAGSVVGQASAFADSKHTHEIFYRLATELPNYPVEAHRNIIIVGTQADPRKDHTRDEHKLRDMIQGQIRDQISALPPDARLLDVAALMHRIVLAYFLDDSELDDLKRDAAGDDERFAQWARNKQRVQAFHAALETTISALHVGFSRFRRQVTKDELVESESYFESRVRRYQALARARLQIEELAAKYKNEESQREQAWSSLVTEIEEQSKCQRNRVHINVISRAQLYTDASRCTGLITAKFSSNEKNSAHKYIGNKLSEDLSRCMADEFLLSTNSVAGSLQNNLAEFDRTFINKEFSALGAAGGAVELDAALMPTIAFDSSNAFRAALVGTAGATITAAALGNALAATVVSSVIGGTLSAVGAVGGLVGMSSIASVISSALAAIGPAGWLALGVAGVGYAAYKLFKMILYSWQEKLGENVAAWVAQQQTKLQSGLTDSVNKLFDELIAQNRENLSETKGRIDSHIAEIRRIGDNKTESADLLAAAKFYEDHSVVMGKAVSELAQLEAD
jgi:hypothetical protein